MGKLNICYGNIENFLKGKDAVVSISNKYMTSGNVFQLAGWSNLIEYRQKNFPNLMEINEIRKTPGFQLPCDILHIYFLKKTMSDVLKAYVYLYDFILKNNYYSVLVPSFLLPEETMNKDIYQKLIKITRQFCLEHDIELTLVFFDEAQSKLYQGYLNVLNW